MLAHVHIMKTAGQTICDILRRSFGVRHCDLHSGELATADDLRFASRFYPQLESVSAHSIRPYSDLAAAAPAIRYFTFLREPINRCVSHYQYMVVRMRYRGSFEQWLAGSPTNYQTRFLTGSNDAAAAIATIESGQVSFVGLVEKFDRSLELLRTWSQHPLQIGYQSRNIAEDNRIKKAIQANPRQLALLREHNAEDLQLYRHVVDVAFPRQIQLYAQAQEPSPAHRRVSTLLASAKRNLLYKPVARALRKAA